MYWVDQYDMKQPEKSTQQLTAAQRQLWAILRQKLGFYGFDRASGWLDVLLVRNWDRYFELIVCADTFACIKIHCIVGGTFVLCFSLFSLEGGVCFVFNFVLGFVIGIRCFKGGCMVWYDIV